MVDAPPVRTSTRSTSYGNEVKVDDAVEVEGHGAGTVEQDDVAVCAEAAKVDAARTDRAVVDARTEVRRDARDFAQQLLGVARLTQRDFVRPDHRDGRRAFEIRVADQRPRHDDFGRRGRRVLGGILRVSRSRGQCDAQDERRGTKLQL